MSEPGISVYSKLADWLVRQLGRQVELVSGFSYGTIDEMIDDGAVDVGFICGYPYVLKHDRPEPILEVLAAPVMKAPRYRNQPHYISDLIVREGSGYNEENSNEDVAGRRILDEALLSRFEPVKDAHYDGIRRRHALAQRTGLLSIR